MGWEDRKLGVRLPELGEEEVARIGIAPEDHGQRQFLLWFELEMTPRLKAEEERV